MNAVFNSALPAWLRPYALAMADFAAHDGSRVFHLSSCCVGGLEGQGGRFKRHWESFATGEF